MLYIASIIHNGKSNMETISFPFKLNSGKVNSGDVMDERVKRVIHYSTSDLAYYSGVGAGVGDLVFAVSISQAIRKVIKRNIVKSLMNLDNIERVNVVFNQEENGITVSIFYQVQGESSLRLYKVN